MSEYLHAVQVLHVILFVSQARRAGEKMYALVLLQTQAYRKFLTMLFDEILNGSLPNLDRIS